MGRARVELQGKVVAITGGARGIGLEIARFCASAGMKVMIGDLDDGAVQETNGAAYSATKYGVLGLTRAVRGELRGGMAAAIELRRAGYRDLVLFEKAADVGGVWRENTYPGAACDVPSHYYSLSSAPRADWPRRFSRQPTILSYTSDVADEFDLRASIRFGGEVTRARFDAARGCWSVTTADGVNTDVDVLIPAVGQLSRPSLPNIPRRHSFAGSSFHSAQWDHTVALAGKRVAVISSGASAIQFVPEIQPVVGELLLFQRTPPHLLPRPD